MNSGAHAISGSLPASQLDAVDAAGSEKNHGISNDQNKEPAVGLEKDFYEAERNGSKSNILANEDGPDGVKKMEAVTVVWNKPLLYTAMAFIWLIAFTNSLQQQSNWSWTPYVTSSFFLHGLTGITGVVANLVGGVVKLPLAKFIDLVGRPQGFLLMLICVVMSLVLMGACQNVQTYAAAQVFYWTGMNGMTYILNVFIADSTKLQNRMILFAFQSTPYICNTFAGPELGQAFLDHSTWRWGYFAFAIITPFMCIPFWAIFFVMMRRVRQTEIITKEKSGRNILQSIWYWSMEFDLIGILLVVGGFSLFLLPFSLVSYQGEGWKAPMIICMLVFGIVCLVLFGIWEKWFAPKTFFPFFLMKHRSMIGACLLGCNTWISFYCYKMYFGSYLQVVFQLSVAKSGYITNIYNIVSCFWSVVVALAFKYFDRYKFAIYIAAPLQLLMTGLMIKLRAPDTPLAALVFVEVMGSICGGTFVMTESLSVMAAVPHENLAVGLALLGMITSVGGSIGQTISGAIWTNILPQRINEYLPEDMKNQSALIYGSLVTQLSYEWGTPTRDAIVRAYGDVQLYMVIAATATFVPCFIWVFMIKDVRLSQRPAHSNGLLF